MKRVHRAAPVALALFAALAIAACGSEEQNDYVEQVNAEQTELLAQLTEAASTPPTNAQGAAQLVEGMQEAFQTTADDLEAIDPPEEVADLHAQLVTTVSEIGDQVSQLGDALSGSPQQAAQAAVELQTSMAQAETELSGLIDQINAELGG